MCIDYRITIIQPHSPPPPTPLHQLCTTLLPPLVELVASPLGLTGDPLPPASHPHPHAPPLKLQRKALTMLRSILVASEHMEPVHKELMSALWSSYLPKVMRTLQHRIAEPVVVGVCWVWMGVGCGWVLGVGVCWVWGGGWWFTTYHNHTGGCCAVCGSDTFVFAVKWLQGVTRMHK